MRLVIDSPEIPVAKVEYAFSEALRQLGCYSDPSADQVVHVKYVKTCDDCAPNTAGYTDYFNDTITLVEKTVSSPVPDKVQDVIMHELGHVFGMHYHLHKETHAMMTPDFADRIDHRHYLPIDINAICVSGNIRGGVCLAPLIRVQ